MSLPCLRATQDKSLQHWYNEYIEFFECQATRRAEFNTFYANLANKMKVPLIPGLIPQASLSRYPGST